MLNRMPGILDGAVSKPAPGGAPGRRTGRQVCRGARRPASRRRGGRGGACRHRPTIVSSSTSGTNIGGPTGIRRHSMICWFRAATASRTSCSDRMPGARWASSSRCLRSLSGGGSISSIDTPSRCTHCRSQAWPKSSSPRSGSGWPAPRQVVERAPLLRLIYLLVDPRGPAHARGLRSVMPLSGRQRPDRRRRPAGPGTGVPSRSCRTPGPRARPRTSGTSACCRCACCRRRPTGSPGTPSAFSRCRRLTAATTAASASPAGLAAVAVDTIAPPAIGRAARPARQIHRFRLSSSAAPVSTWRPQVVAQLAQECRVAAGPAALIGQLGRSVSSGTRESFGISQLFSSSRTCSSAPGAIWPAGSCTVTI